MLSIPVESSIAPGKRGKIITLKKVKLKMAKKGKYHKVAPKEQSESDFPMLQIKQLEKPMTKRVKR